MTAPYRILLGSRASGSLPQQPPERHIEALVQAWKLLASTDPQSTFLYEAENAPEPRAVEVARSVALLCPRKFMNRNAAGRWELDTSPGGVLIGGQDFKQQELVDGTQSAFLVRPDLLLTSVHYLKAKKVPARYRAVFDFKLVGDKVPDTFSDDQVFDLAEAVDFGDPYHGNEFDDWLVLRLARPTKGREAAILGVGVDDPSPNTRLWMLGHPLGLPMKYVGGATVREVDKKARYFKSDLAGVDGNSGSLVVDGKQIVGLLHDAGGGFSYGGYDWTWCPDYKNCPTEVTSCTAFAHALVPRPAVVRLIRRSWRRVRTWARAHTTVSRARQWRARAKADERENELRARRRFDSSRGVP